MTFKQIVEVYKIPQSSPFLQATPTTFDRNLHNEKSFDLYMFSGNITTGILTVNGYHKQQILHCSSEDHYLIFAPWRSVNLDFERVFQQ